MLMTASQSKAITTLKRPGFSLPDEEKALILPDRYFYFEDTEDGPEGASRRLHCYDNISRTDVATDVYIPSFMSKVEGIWQDPVSENVFVAWEEGGMEIRELYVMGIDNNFKASKYLHLNGFLPTKWNDYDTSAICHIKLKDNYVEAKGSDEKTGERINAIYTLGMKKGSYPPPSKIKVDSVAYKFVEVLADGVNIRKEPNAKSPKLGITGYYDYEMADDDNAEYAWENEEKTIKTYHPRKGSILESGGYVTEGFVPVRVVGKYGFISSEFVNDLEPESLQPPFKAPYEYEKIHCVEEGKYKGLYMYSLGEWAPIYFGKKADNQIVFFGVLSQGFTYDENETEMVESQYGFTFGKNRAMFPEGSDRGIPDVEKFTEKDLDFLYPYVSPVDKDSFLVRLKGTNLFISK